MRWGYPNLFWSKYNLKKKQRSREHQLSHFFCEITMCSSRIQPFNDFFFFSNGQKRKKKKQRSRDDDSSSSSSSSSDDSDSNSDSDSDKNNDKKKLGKRDTKQVKYGFKINKKMSKGSSSYRLCFKYLKNCQFYLVKRRRRGGEGGKNCWFWDDIVYGRPSKEK